MKSLNTYKRNDVTVSRIRRLSTVNSSHTIGHYTQPIPSTSDPQNLPYIHIKGILPCPSRSFILLLSKCVPTNARRLLMCILTLYKRNLKIIRYTAEVRLSVGSRLFSFLIVQTGFEAHPACYPTGIGGSFPGG